MRNLLITGATGNVGGAILKQLNNNAHQKVWKAAYGRELLPDEKYFNFDDLTNTRRTLEDIDTLFLLRPPHISDVKKFFTPLLQACKDAHVKHIVFLSVQGVDKSSIIPHHKIEKLIIESGIPYTFIRPSYFMQNLTTMLKADIKNNNLIYLPAGKAKFLWVDVNDIGKAIAVILSDPSKHVSKHYTMTGSELFTFAEVAERLSNILNRPIRYVSPGLVRFYFQKRKEGNAPSYIFVLIMLHYLARFETPPKVYNDFAELTGEQPNTLSHFIKSHQVLLS
jgi:uncharacterized protein YbjT (DUF2867 family)